MNKEPGPFPFVSRVLLFDFFVNNSKLRLANKAFRWNNLIINHKGG